MKKKTKLPANTTPTVPTKFDIQPMSASMVSMLPNQITPAEQIELDKLKQEDKHRLLSDREENRLNFLSSKTTWKG